MHLNFYGDFAMYNNLEMLPEAELVQDLAIPSSRMVALSALRSFSDIGFHATSTRHITEGASVSAGSLYTHFKSKEDILYFWMLEGHRSALATVNDAVRNTNGLEDRIAAIVKDLTLWHIKYRTLSQLNTKQLNALSNSHYGSIREYRRQITEALRLPVDEIFQTNVSYVLSTELYLNAVFAIILDVSRWFPRNGRMDPQAVAKCYAEFALTMLMKN